VLVLGAALLPLFPGLSLRSGAVLVPIGNVALAVRDILTGSARALDATLAWVFTAAVAWAVLRLVAAGLHREDLLFGEGAEARPATTGLERLGRDLGLWLAGAWAAFVLVSVYLEGQVGLAMQILVNVVVLFLGGSLVVARIYGVDVIRTFALRRPDWRAWPLVAVGAPASVVLGVGISHLSQTLFPPTADMLDQFEALILESGLGTWQLLLLAAVLPGICEELAFRGLILHAWMTRAPVWRACVLSGVAFALFHLMAFRLATTAVLGTVLAFVTAWTGSLYPAIAWHVLNNAIGLLAGDSGAGAFLAAPPSWAYGAAAVILALALGALRRLRNQAATGG
jgi:sodium transport system permease protein